MDAAGVDKNSEEYRRLQREIIATEQALKDYPGLPIVFSGGVASNSMLRDVMKPLNPVFSQPQFSTDNAMGVAVLAHRMMEV